MCQRDHDEASDVEGELDLDVHPDANHQACQGGRPRATEVFAGEYQPNRYRNKGGHRSVEHEDVRQGDQQRRAEGEHNRQHAGLRAKEKLARLVAAECQQRQKENVLANDGRSHIHPTDEHRECAYYRSQRGIQRGVRGGPKQVSCPQHVVIFDRRQQMVTGIVYRNAAVLRQPPASDPDKYDGRTDCSPGRPARAWNADRIGL